MNGTNRRRRRLARLAAALLGVWCLGYFGRSNFRDFDRSWWLEDYASLRKHVEESYANLEWSVAEGRIDPYELNRQTLTALERATTSAEARRAVLRFVWAFGDSHIAARKPDRTLPRWIRWFRGELDDPDPKTPPERACRLMEYGESVDPADLDFLLPFDRLRSFERLPGENSFPAGLLTLPSLRVGVLRIPTFAEEDYFETCVRGWRAYRTGLSGECDSGCQGEFWQAHRQRLLSDLESRIVALSTRGIDVLLVDLTGNPGGHDWSKPAARLFTTRKLDDARASFVKGREARKEFRKLEKIIRSELESGCASPEVRQWLGEGAVRLAELIAETERPCDRSPLFLRKDAKLGCSQLIRNEYFDDGLFAESPPGVGISDDLRFDLFESWWPATPEGLYDGPLLLLVDRDTGSAAELFAMQLRDNRAALVLGERTSGSGGGWTLGLGNPFVLPHTRIRVHIPDSVSYRLDGRNARVGLEPDVCVEWGPGASETSRLRSVMVALRQF